MAGKIQLIITKSVSRFARNTVDTLQTIRKLKDKGIEVYFEKENIWTFDGKGELLITIMASLAQEESRSLSDNVTWGKRKSMSDGNISLPWSAFLGYRKGEGYFGRKVWGSYKGDKSRRRYIWQCNDKYRGDHRCTTPHITEDELKSRFLAVWNGMADNRDHLIADCRAAKIILCDCKDINAEIKELEREVEVVTELSRKAIFENARTAQNQAEFNERNNGYIERINTARDRIEDLNAEKRRRQHKARILESYIRNLESNPAALIEFDDKVWLTSIEKAVVAEDGTITFHFLDGSEVVG